MKKSSIRIGARLQAKKKMGGVKFLTVLSCIFFSQNLSAQANPPVTPEFIMASGPYTNVLNTSVHQESVSGSSTITTVQVFAWDGDRPSIAQTWGPGSVLERASLPPGATDPDIIVGDNGEKILVAYELGGNIVLDLYENSLGGGSLLFLSDHLISNASNPNLDKPSNCDESLGNYALVYEDNTGGNDILLAFGVFFPSFLPPFIATVPLVSLPPVGDPYTNRVNPDVMYIEDEIYVTAAGRNSNFGDFYVDIFYVPIPGFPIPTVTGLLTAGGPLNSLSTQVYPRIDGLVFSSPSCYEFSLTYGDNSLVYNAYNNTTFGVISQSGSSNNELPAVSFRGDYNDVIWTASGPGSYTNEIIGLGAAGCAKDTYYKQVNAVVGPGTTNLFPNISGTCSDPVKNDYAMIWWEQNSANIYYKFANAGTTSYKNAGDIATVENFAETEFPTLVSKNLFNWESDKHLEFEIRNLSGQLVGLYSLAEFKAKLGSFENGLYIFKITDKLNQICKVEKVLIKS